MAGYFITATGTDAGKTLLAAGLAAQLRGQGKAVLAVKPVASGFTADRLAESDTGILLAAQGREVSLAEADAISPWRYARPVSPHLAAEGDESLSAEAVTIFCEAALMRGGMTLIEGAGGVMSPLVQGFTQADLLQRLGIPAVLVAGSYLGSISHTLTAVEALRARGIAIASLVVCDAPGGDVPLADTRNSIASHLPEPIPVFTLPRISPTTEPAWRMLPPMTEVLTHE